MIAELKVQRADQNAADQAVLQARADNTGGVMVSDAHGRYQDAVRRGNVFTCANQAGIATPAGLTATALNYTLYNPLGSGKNLVLLEVLMALTAAPAAATALVLAANMTPSAAAPSTNTVLVIRNALLGGGNNSVAQVYSITTLPAAPIAIRAMAFIDAASNVGAAFFKDEVAGAIVVAPGCCVSLQATTVATLITSMTWEEVPV